MYDKEFLAGNGEVPESEMKLGNDKQQQWDENHKLIIDFVHKYMQSYFQTPTAAIIAEKTGLSRPTVYKHMKSFATDPGFQEHTAIYKLMVTDLLRQLYSQSMYGEVKAARLYLELMGVLKTGKVVNNSFINSEPASLKINNTVLTEELIQGMSADEKNQVEGIILNAGKKDLAIAI